MSRFVHVFETFFYNVSNKWYQRSNNLVPCNFQLENIKFKYKNKEIHKKQLRTIKSVYEPALMSKTIKIFQFPRNLHRLLPVGSQEKNRTKKKLKEVIPPRFVTNEVKEFLRRDNIYRGLRTTNCQVLQFSGKWQRLLFPFLIGGNHKNRVSRCNNCFLKKQNFIHFPKRASAGRLIVPILNRDTP